MTAYSTAVGPSSARRNLRSFFMAGVGEINVHELPSELATYRDPRRVV
jgi:hypothetical protein